MLLLSFPVVSCVNPIPSSIIYISIDESEPKQTDRLVWPRRDVSSAFHDVPTEPSIQHQQRDDQIFAACSLRSI